MRRSKSSCLKLKKEVESCTNITDSIKKKNISYGKTTPHKLHVSTQSDLLSLDYYSNVCTQTQDGGIEVTWDWHSPGRKAIGVNGRNIKTYETSCDSTPKRAPIHNKRISNSPLMYKPLKRKLIKQENTDDINKFKAELIALSEQIKNEQEDKDKLLTDESKGIVPIEIPNEIQFSDFSDDESDLEVCISNETNESLKKCKRKDNEAFDDLFDDSLNETMIRCSQEIEERLNIAPINSKEQISSSTIRKNNEHFLVRNNSRSSLMSVSENKFGSLTRKKLNVNLPATKIDLTNTQGNTIKKCNLNVMTSKFELHNSKNMISAKNTNISSDIVADIQQHRSISKNSKFNLNRGDINEFNIPDDSFDEFLATCEEELPQSQQNSTVISMSPSHCGIVNDCVHCESPKKSTNPLLNVPTKLLPSTLLKRINNVSNSNTIKMNMVAKIASGKPTTQSNSNFTTNRNWKFFKSKSHSDSSFSNNTGINSISNSKSVNQFGHQNAFRGGSNINLDLRGGSKEVSNSSVSTEHKIPSIRRTASCLESNAMARKSMQKVNIHNTQMNHVDRYAANEDGNTASNNIKAGNSGEDACAIQLLQLCGPEEIKRKRMEAKMKLDAKKKREKILINPSIVSPYVPNLLLNIQNKR